MSSRERLGWNPFFAAQVATLARTDLAFARVIEEQRELYTVAGDVEGRAEVSGRFRHAAVTPGDFPAVGDWVGVRDGIIHCRLERRSRLARAAAGRAVAEQIVAANVDTVFLVTALAGDLNVRRLERYLTMVWDGGAVPAILLNKADLSPDPDAEAASVRARLPLVDVVVASALDDRGLEALTPYLGSGQTIALVGSSGVGKSTLVNRLTRREVQRVGAIREEDGRGRHTTTARQLLELPGGALLIDTPGMRELKPWGDESAVEAAFDDVATLAAGCRFLDCAHEREPGCAVVAAIEQGRLDPARLEHFRHLAREAAFEERRRDKAAASNAKKRWKQSARALKTLYDLRGRDE